MYFRRYFYVFVFYSISLIAMMQPEDEGSEMRGSTINYETFWPQPCAKSKKQKKKKHTLNRDVIESTNLTDIEDDSDDERDIEEGSDNSITLDRIHGLCNTYFEHCSDKHKQELKEALFRLYVQDPQLIQKMFKNASTKNRNIDFLQAAMQANEIFNLAVEQLLQEKDESIDSQGKTITKKSFQQKITAAVGGTAFVVQFAFMILLLVQQIIEC